MTHTRQLEDYEGNFSPWKDAQIECPRCGAPGVEYRSWESTDGGYEDYQYRCAACRRTWWVDGIDS